MSAPHDPPEKTDAEPPAERDRKATPDPAVVENPATQGPDLVGSGDPY
jgi:hypothetical protein